mmetsp:Transcript_380/g.692  ORF Transcript_380/g.692 Transcript_380/m.692 type:complete len:568 (+) Transcript_380:1378-3081(+)|eukprot:CAMPEP_0117422408 /NCGR_PEP_ID=MMETSP0758-20121206/3254_1 /TAXON_ID=63605 /ORGANISM="Percolomonas cosmopolitus, Strain AE-1 (ATCC 50343)" /LENGTH=567 /DNA_ID=CAMNT_0005205011 /DNA_START=1271 /DNA_END=2974 /DNA_ORIENTATION=-
MTDNSESSVRGMIHAVTNQTNRVLPIHENEFEIWNADVVEEEEEEEDLLTTTTSVQEFSPLIKDHNHSNAEDSMIIEDTPVTPVSPLVSYGMPSKPKRNHFKIDNTLYDIEEEDDEEVDALKTDIVPLEQQTPPSKKKMNVSELTLSLKSIHESYFPTKEKMEPVLIPNPSVSYKSFIEKDVSVSLVPHTPSENERVVNLPKRFFAKQEPEDVHGRSSSLHFVPTKDLKHYSDYLFGENDTIRVQIVTWNMGESSGPDPKMLLQQQFLQQTSNHLYVIGTQECERSIPKSVINAKKTKWIRKLKSLICADEKFEMLEHQTLLASHIIIFAQKPLIASIKNLQKYTVRTGFLGIGGNKGAVAISFDLFDRRLCFINVHLPAHQKAVKERNAAFRRVMHDLVKSQKASTLSEAFDVVFFFGDTNYRIHATRQAVDQCLDMLSDPSLSIARRQMYFQMLLDNDQLGQAKRKKKAFTEFIEPPITFLPTYKMERESDVYDQSEKQRVPSWTDRILFFDSKRSHSTSVSSNAPFGSSLVSQFVKCLEYDVLSHARHSDHRPVHGRYLIKVKD